MNRPREKLINAVVYFASATKYCGLTKMMKLLNFFEFEHFNQTGVPPIGLTYYAYENGPLPFKFWVEVNRGSLTKDFNDVLFLQTISYPNGYQGYNFVPREGVVPNLKVFSPREFRIMQALAKEYFSTSAVDMSEISHKDKLPWKKTVQTKGLEGEIDYLDSLADDSEISLEEARTSLEEFKEARKILDLEPTNIEW